MSMQTRWILNVAPAWVPDEDAILCHCCKEEFSFFKRKHHCRNCGSVVCNNCSQRRICLPQYGIKTQVRVCISCFPETTIIRKDDN